MAVVWTIKEKCQRCYTCIRECPAKAIKVHNGQAEVIPERCIGCGHCYKVCTQGAKEIASGLPAVERMLGEQTEKLYPVALLAPSFPAAYPEIPYRKIVGGLLALGFKAVYEVAAGAELVNEAYKKILHDPNSLPKPLLASSCPAIVDFVQKYKPELIGHLIPVVSPMTATAKMVKQLTDRKALTVFIGPCIAKKMERLLPEVSEWVDEVLTFEELNELLEKSDISFSQSPDGEFTPPHARLAGLYPVSGGLTRSAGLTFDLLDNNIILTEGKMRSLELLDLISRNAIEAEFIDILFCEGCINGPAMASDKNYFSRKNNVVNFVTTRSDNHTPVEPLRFSSLELCCTFSADDHRLPEPDEEEIKRIFRRINKLSAKDELNCGACGYPTCREYAKAVYTGLAEEEMCLPFLIEKIEHTRKELQNSLQELNAMQEQLIQSEKLASVGQLAAGVAHEVNNPLASIILYAHLLLKNFPTDDAKAADISLILNEAERCQRIVSGLLDFARQGKLALHKADIYEIINRSVEKFNKKYERNITIIAPEKIPQFYFDPDQITQVIDNLLKNSIDATAKEDDIQVVLTPEAQRMTIVVKDSGCGIKKEDQPKLFTPFFTTKRPGQGTGLGLPIVYGIIKMHRGQISVRSKENKGTEVKIILPTDLKNIEYQQNQKRLP